MLTIHSPAKINLFLHVIGRRADGYHEIFTLMSPLTFGDEIRIAAISEGLQVRCDHPQVPEDESNLAYRAAEVFFRAQTSRQGNSLPSGIRISIQKQIPVGAGLGGGSSNAAAVLRGLNRICKAPFSRKELIQMGREIGADVPFFVLGTPAFASGIGDRLRPCSMPASVTVLVIDPGIYVSTAEVYKNLDLGLTNCQKEHKDLPLKFRLRDLANHLCNDLETVTLNRHPEISEVKRVLMANGARGALMSGSGSSVFGLFDSRRAALRARDKISRAEAWQIILSELAVQDVAQVQ